ncbi:MAG: PilC/PilY family type IV pilus protein [Halioglobus sp.]
MKRLLLTLLTTLLGGTVPLAYGEDTDLFMGDFLDANDPPNVLLVLDNTANWGPDARFQDQKNALIQVFESLPANAVKVGLMMFTESGGGNGNTDGAYVRAAIRLMDDPNDPTSTNSLYRNMIGAFDVGDDASNSGKAGLTMAEAYHYFAGEAPYAGDDKNKADYYANDYNFKSCCDDSNLVWDLPGNALASREPEFYTSPVDPYSCSKNYVIFVGNGPASDSNRDTADAAGLLTAQGGSTQTIPIAPDFQSRNVANEWARFMKQSPLDITTFSVDINVVNTLDQLESNQNAGWSALMKSMADVSGGRYYNLGGTAFDPNELKLALGDAFSRIISTDSVFASVALPASANAQSTFLNQVFIGQFRPNANGTTRWPGNLKQYQFGFVGTELKIVDADGEKLIEDNTGFIQDCARSFWTPDSGDTYWNFSTEPRGDCSTSVPASNSPDGPNVEKGGQAYTLRESTSRTVYSCSPVFASCTSFTSFNNTLDPSLFGAGLTSAERDTLVEWAIGHDTENEVGASPVPASPPLRPTVHGDVVHTQPVAINYGNNDASPQVVVFYSGNDGMLRAINGNQTSDIGSYPAGYELWSFMPPEFFGKIKTLYDNTSTIRFPSSGANKGATGVSKPYGIDGPIKAFEGTIGVVDKKYLYAGMRRGGRALYAFDVSTAASPQLLWKRGCPNLANDTDCSSGTAGDWSGIGQTWSPATVTSAANYTNPILIMGGGYDDCEDWDNDTDANNSCTSGFRGNRIYVIDGVTGNILQSFTTDRPVPGGITVVPTSDLDPDILYAYAADTGGNVYRISGATAGVPVGSTAPGASAWTMTKIASVGCGTTATATCNANRKFLFGPDVVKINPDGSRMGVLLGSGDREKPLSDYGGAASVDNYFFSLIDEPSNSSWLTDDGTCAADELCMDVLTEVATGDAFDPNTIVSDKGWFLPLAQTEQVVTGALVVSNTAVFSTHIPFDPATAVDPNDPNAPVCANQLGVATTYNVDYRDAGGEAIPITGGGLVPTPVAGKVLIDGTAYPFIIGGGEDNSAIGGGSAGSGATFTQPKTRVYWKIGD